MFRWLINSVSSAVAATVSPVFGSNFDQFKYSWKVINDEYQAIISNGRLNFDDPAVITTTSISDNLTMLVSCLIQEQDEIKANSNSTSTTANSSSDPNNNSNNSNNNASAKRRAAAAAAAAVAAGAAPPPTGPCLQFLLHNSVIDQLVALALPDRPAGIRPLVTRALDSLLADVRYPLLRVTAVHVAVRQFTNVCISRGDLNAHSHKTALTGLLATLCALIGQDQVLCDKFFDFNDHPVGAVPVHVEAATPGRQQAQLALKSAEADAAAAAAAAAAAKATVAATATADDHDDGAPTTPLTGPRAVDPTSNSNVVAPEDLASSSAAANATGAGTTSRSNSVASETNSNYSANAARCRSLSLATPPPRHRSRAVSTGAGAGPGTPGHRYADESKFPVFTALLSLVNSDDDGPDFRVHHGLLACARLPHPAVAQYITAETPFCADLVVGLKERFGFLLAKRNEITSANPEGHKGLHHHRHHRHHQQNDDPTNSAGADDEYAHHHPHASPGGSKFRSALPQLSLLIDAFMDRFMYIDAVVKLSRPCYAAALSRELTEGLLAPLFKPLVEGVVEATAVWTTDLLREMVSTAESKELQRALFRFILGDVDISSSETDVFLRGTGGGVTSEQAASRGKDEGECDGEVEDTNESAEHHAARKSDAQQQQQQQQQLLPNQQHTAPSLRSIIINRIDGLNERLCAATLALVDAVLAKQGPLAVHSLLTRHLVGLAHIEPSARIAAAAMSRPRPVGPSDLPPLLAPFAAAAAATAAGTASASAAGQLAPYIADARRSCILAVESWRRYTKSGERGWLETQLRRLAGADSIYQRAQMGAAALLTLSNENNESDNNRGNTAASAIARTNNSGFDTKLASDAHVYRESAFIRALLNKLENLFANSFAVNLYVTSILSQLCLCPHPLVHGYLLDPRTPFLHGGAGATTTEAGGTGTRALGPRCLLRVVSDLSDEAQKRAVAVERYDAKVRDSTALLAPGSFHCRRLYKEFAAGGGAVSTVAKNSLPTPLAADVASPAGTRGGLTSASGKHGIAMTREQVFLDAVVLLREFTKELIAILHAKAELSGLQAAQTRRSMEEAAGNITGGGPQSFAALAYYNNGGNLGTQVPAGAQIPPTMITSDSAANNSDSTLPSPTLTPSLSASGRKASKGAGGSSSRSSSHSRGHSRTHSRSGSWLDGMLVPAAAQVGPAPSSASNGVSGGANGSGGLSSLVEGPELGYNN